jgi:O-antigen/teichoic acid export membrane protein
MQTISQKTFFAQFAHFFTGQALTLCVGFVTFPILTRLLPTEDYGVMSLVTNTMAIAVALAKIGVSDGIIRFHDEFERSCKINVFSSTVITSGLLSASVVLVCYLISLPFLLRLIGINEKYMSCFQIMALYLFLRPLNIIFLNLMRVRSQTIKLNIVNLVNRLISVFVGLYILIYIIRDVYGYFIGIVIGEWAIGIFLGYWFFSHYKVKISDISLSLTRSLIKFGLPLLFSEMAYLVMSYADRFMIVNYYDEKALGLYSVGYNLAMYISGVITFSMSYAIVPSYMKIYAMEGREHTELFLEDCLYYFLIFTIPICFGYAAVAKEIFHVLASEKYTGAATFSPLILVGSLSLGLNGMLNAGLYVNKKTNLILGTMIFGVVVNIFLNMLLLPSFNVFGASLATLISCILTTVLTVLLSFRFIRIQFRKKIIWHVMLALLMFVVVINLNFNLPLLTLIIKIIIGFIIIFFGFLFLEKEIIHKMKSIFSLQ